MSSRSSGSFLDFFVLEASEYVEQIDGLLARAAETGGGPDSDALQRISRALRGSATMAKLPSFAELASSLESVGRALREGSLGWNEALKAALTAAVDDLKILVRAARAWTPTEDEWALRRVAELSQYAPVTPQSAPTPIAATSPTFFAGESANIAAGLELLATRPGDRDLALNVLRRVRALRGVAGLRDITALGEVLEAAETALRPIELGEGALAPERVNVLRASADLLRIIASGLSGGAALTETTPQYMGFLAARDAMLADVGGADRVIPIDRLFYDDAGPYVVNAAPNPPTTPAQRFRMEVVSLGEHLHRVIDEARSAQDAIQREYARGELSRALRAIRATAASFGQMSVAQTVEAYLERTGDLNVSALDAISSFASTISPAATAPTPALGADTAPIRMSAARSALASLGTPNHPRPAPLAPAAPPPRASVPVSIPTPPPQHAPPTPPTPPVSHARVFAAVHNPQPAAPARPSQQMPWPSQHAAPSTGGQSLESTIAAFESLSNERMAEPAAIDNDLLPVDALLYRGRAALDRALEIRDAIRKLGVAPPREVLEELYDLVELARYE
jgi:chemotaxis protein histidine kinase CheA